MRALCARPAAAISWPPAASSEARASSFGRASVKSRRVRKHRSPPASPHSSSRLLKRRGKLGGLTLGLALGEVVLRKGEDSRGRMAGQFRNLGDRLRPRTTPARMRHPYELSRLLAVLREPGADRPRDAARPDRPAQDDAIAGREPRRALDLGPSLEQRIEHPIPRSHGSLASWAAPPRFPRVSRRLPERGARPSLATCR